MGKKRSRRNSKKKKIFKGSNRNKAVSSRSKKLPYLVIVLLFIASVGYFLYDRYDRSGASNIQNAVSSDESSADLKSLRGGETRPTLKPSRFRGKVAMAYSIASEERELLDSLYCYCYCKTKFGHKSLLSCYVDTHAVQCDICLDQTLYAHSLFEKGQYYPQVRAAVDRKFWRPFS